jgi:iron(III) transport system substrate-binding protein
MRNLKPLIVLLLLAACADDGRTPLVVYSPHGPDLLREFEARFEAIYPDVDVQWLDMGSQEVLDRLRSERANPQADVWFGAPAEMFALAAEEGLLAESRPGWAASVVEHSDAQGRYHGIYLTPEVIAFNSEVLTPEQAPQDWDEVLEPRWRDQVLIRDPLASGTMRTIFGMIILRSIRETGSPDQGFDWLRRLDGQTKEYVLNPTLLYQKLARQEGLVTLWTMPDIELLKSKTGYPLDYVFPRSGTPLVVDAIAMVEGSRNPEAARAFIEFAGSLEMMTLAAHEFYRLPAHADFPTDSLPAGLRRAKQEMRVEPMDWPLLQQRGSEWMRRWDERVRGRG